MNTHTYTVTMLYSDPICDGRAQSYMTTVDATSPEAAAEMAMDEMDDDGAYVVSVILGEHNDLYPH